MLVQHRLCKALRKVKKDLHDLTSGIDALAAPTTFRALNKVHFKASPIRTCCHGATLCTDGAIARRKLHHFRSACALNASIACRYIDRPRLAHACGYRTKERIAAPFKLSKNAIRLRTCRQKYKHYQTTGPDQTLTAEHHKTSPIIPNQTDRA